MSVHPESNAELLREQRKIYAASGAAFLLCIVLLGGAHAFLPDLVEFQGEALESRLSFLAGATLFLAVWVIVGIGMVARGRRRSAEDIGGSAYSRPSPRIAVASAFLQNTLEQSVVAAVAMFALLMLAGAAGMPFIAAWVVLFGIGRITFFLGYPKGAGGRAFGMALTMLPSIAAFLISIALLVARF